jgi:hypothetical protein
MDPRHKMDRPRLSPKRQAERNSMAERVRALEGRVERLGSDRQLVWFYREWCELQEYWLHAPNNEEALHILPRCLENAAWCRAQRLFRKAHRARADRKHELAEQLWRQGRERLAEDWEIFFRRAPIPDVGELYERGPPARGP